MCSYAVIRIVVFLNVSDFYFKCKVIKSTCHTQNANIVIYIKKTYFLCVCTTKLCLKEWIKMTGLKSTRPRALQFIDRSKHSATNEIKITRIVVYVYLVAMLLPSYMYRMFICLFLSPCVSQSVVYIVLYLKKKTFK